MLKKIVFKYTPFNFISQELYEVRAHFEEVALTACVTLAGGGGRELNEYPT